VDAEPKAVPALPTVASFANSLIVRLNSIMWHKKALRLHE